MTREQASTIIFRAINAVLGEDALNNSVRTNVAFTDAGNISSYAQQAVNAMAGAGILTGYSDGTFRPGQNITMEQTAVILDRVIDNYILR